MFCEALATFGYSVRLIGFGCITTGPSRGRISATSDSGMKPEGRSSGAGSVARSAMSGARSRSSRWVVIAPDWPSRTAAEKAPRAMPSAEAVRALGTLGAIDPHMLGMRTREFVDRRSEDDAQFAADALAHKYAPLHDRYMTVT